MIPELPVSPSDQARCTTDPTRRWVIAGAPGADVGLVGSKAANRRRPLDWRAIVPVAPEPLPLAVSGAWAQLPPEQPLTYPASTRPCLSIETSKKSSRLRQILAPPPVQIQPRWIGALGVASDTLQVAPPSKVCAT